MSANQDEELQNLQRRVDALQYHVEELQKATRDSGLQLINRIEIMMGVEPTTSELRRRWRRAQYDAMGQFDKNGET